MSLLDVRVAEARMLTPVVRELVLTALDGPLPAFSSGSHVQVVLNDGGRTYRNAYSLAGDPAERNLYRIAVRRHVSSRGGSAFVHDRLEPGARLRITAPANLFALNATARHHVLVAGGIGITPFIAHLAELERRQASHELHHAYRAGLTDAYRASLDVRLGARFHGYDGVHARFDAIAMLQRQPLGTHVYVCGPASLLDAVRAAAAALGWPAGRVHWEAFVAPAPGQPFAVDLRRSGRRIAVGAEQSLLEALESAGIDVPNLCRGGACGQCATRYLDGTVEHRDAFLDADARATHLMPCVSRACGAALTLDL
ncbi:MULTISPECIES: PDR/VanB family oxidoreductase [unclassified Burkholderia]|uniref:PDR/VanB family oxidoreductase n=1 Tax=unclassified Burkholderia TaxID=2613784 RepID=UPI000F55E4E5|nr:MULTISPECIES: PDR/VanB family oxidoreductase [unclassified Burkholderia]RQR79006.1 oxidoreductase [Burkholderia sp. Bp9011]RQR89202.1 oxidoreductase [Burkholderia sp. Bp9010]RQS71877.1 oxidoreductase [Burkholderia sp. Bp8977]